MKHIASVLAVWTCLFLFSARSGWAQDSSSMNAVNAILVAQDDGNEDPPPEQPVAEEPPSMPEAPPPYPDDPPPSDTVE